jgi:hypothetical protein
MSYTEVRSMPIVFREWFIKRYVREHEERNAAHTRAAREANNNLDRAATVARAFSR